MGLTVREVLERSLNEIINSGGVSIPAWSKNTVAVGDTTTKTFTIDDRVEVPGDAVIEFDDDSMEICDVEEVTGTSVTVFSRGYLETTADTHSINTKVIIDPPFPKIARFNALVSVIRSLYGMQLYDTATSTDLTFSTLSPRTLPAAAKDVFPVIYALHANAYDTLKRGSDFEVLHFFSPKKLQFFGGTYEGAALTIPYKKDFTVPDALGDDLSTDCGLPDSLLPFLPMAIASVLLEGKEVPAVQADYVQRQLEAQASPVGSRTSVARSLWNRFLGQVHLEKLAQLESAPATIETRL